MDTERARELLASQRERVESALAALRTDIASTGDDEDETGGGAGAGRLLDEEVDFGLVDQLSGELDAIARAEQRLRDGTYGRSVVSGEPIPDERLELFPWAERTVEEQGRVRARGLAASPPPRPRPPRRRARAAPRRARRTGRSS